MIEAFIIAWLTVGFSWAVLQEVAMGHGVSLDAWWLRALVFVSTVIGGPIFVLVAILYVSGQDGWIDR